MLPLHKTLWVRTFGFGSLPMMTNRPIGYWRSGRSQGRFQLHSAKVRQPTKKAGPPGEPQRSSLPVIGDFEQVAEKAESRSLTAVTAPKRLFSNLLEHVPEELVIDLVMILNFGRFHKCA